MVLSNVAVIPHNRVEYILEHLDFSPISVTEPDGWDIDAKEYARLDDEGFDGVITKFSSKSLTFKKDGKDFIKMIYTIYGPNTQIVCKKRERHPQTNRWRLAYLGYLDLATYVFQNNAVQIKFNASTLQDILKTRATEKIEIERLDTMDGDTLPELKTETVVFNGRRIFLKSELSTSETNNEVVVSVESNAGNTRAATVALPLKIDTNQHQDILQAPTFNQNGRENVGDIGLMLLLDVDRDRNFNIDLSFATDAFFQQYENVQWCFYQICLTVYENGLNFNLKDRIVLDELSSGFQNGNPKKLPRDFDFAYPQFTKAMAGNFNGIIELKKGESLAFEAFLKSDMYMDNTAGVRVFTKKLITSLNINEDSYKAPSTAKVVMAHELGNRITQIITGRDDAFYSDALGRTDLGYAQDGVETGALNGFSHGLWMRGFDKLPETEDNKYKAFTTTFKDFADHKKATWNLGVGIEKIGLKERIRIEKKDFFYQNIVTIHVGYKDVNNNWVYPQVNNLKRNPSSSHFYSTLEFGYTKGWENEEAMGLDEPNAKSTFTTPITNSSLKNTYSQISKYIAGAYPKEFIRRKPKSEFPTTDHNNDKEVFVHDLKRDGLGTYTERKWEDDFEEAPTGIFSPETATNLRLSVVNNLLRHGWVIASTMIKEAGKYIRYGSSEGNSKMTTKLIGGKPYTENGTGNTSNIIVKEDLPKAKIYPEDIEFEYKVTTEMIEQIEGSTIINGKSVPNFYGLVKFRNEEGNLETGFFWNLKPNDKGKWQLLKSN